MSRGPTLIVLVRACSCLNHSARARPRPDQSRSLVKRRRGLVTDHTVRPGSQPSAGCEQLWRHHAIVLGPCRPCLANRTLFLRDRTGSKRSMCDEVDHRHPAYRDHRVPGTDEVVVTRRNVDRPGRRRSFIRSVFSSVTSQPLASSLFHKSLLRRPFQEHSTSLRDSFCHQRVQRSSICGADFRLPEDC